MTTLHATTLNNVKETRLDGVLKSMSFYSTNNTTSYGQIWYRKSSDAWGASITQGLSGTGVQSPNAAPGVTYEISICVRTRGSNVITEEVILTITPGNSSPVGTPNVVAPGRSFRSAPVALENPYDFPLNVSFVQAGADGAFVTLGNVSLQPAGTAGSTWGGQIWSPNANEIKVQGSTPIGYGLDGAGNFVAGGAGSATGISFIIGGVPAGENIGSPPLVEGGSAGSFVGGGGAGTPQTGITPVVSPGSAPVGWNGASTGTGLTDTQYREGVQATIAAINKGLTGSASGTAIDPRANIDAIGTALATKWAADEVLRLEVVEETKKRREFGDAIATRYNEGVSGYDSGGAVAGVTGQEGRVHQPGSWAGRSVSVSDVSLPGSITVELPDGTDKTLSWSASAMPGGLGGVASVAKGLLLLAASVAMVRGCMGDMRAYIVGLGGVNPAGNGVLVGVESVAPGVPQAKALGLALASTAVIAAAWVGMAALLTSGVLGDAFGRFGSMSLPSGLGVLSEWVPFSGLVMLWVGRAMFDFVAAPVYLGAVSALKFLSV